MGKRFQPKFILSLPIVLSLAACASAGGSGTGASATSGTALQGLASCTAQSGTAVVCGTVFAADGVTPVVNADVTLVSSSGSALIRGLVSDGFGELSADTAACRTDDVGAFACQVDECSGSATFQISGGLFSTPLSFTATCSAGETTQVPSASTTATASQTADVKWLVIPGSYDGIQLLLSELKGCELTGDPDYPQMLSASDECEVAGLTVLDEAEVSDFLATEDLSEYQAIFANCGADFDGDLEATEAIRGYVNAGGNMYFSDLADAWLTAFFPGLVSYPDDKNDTDAGELAAATIVDEGLQVFLGSVAAPQTSMHVEFDLGVWTAIGSAASGWTTYIEADISSLAPTLTGTRPLTVGGPQEDGCVFYTSYHVEAAAAGSDQESALKYLVLNRMGNCE